MITLEQVERLREKAGVGFEDAKAALEAAGGDLLDAIIYLEKQGKVSPPPAGGYYSSDGAQNEEKAPEAEKAPRHSGESFRDMMRRFGTFLLKVLDKGNTNFLDAERAGRLVFSMPVTALVVFLVFFFWVTVPLFVVSLFFGFRYRFRGGDLGKDSVNKVMDGASNAVEEIKRSVGGENKQ